MKKSKHTIPEDLIARYFMGQCTRSEIEELEQCKMENSDNLEEFKKMEEIWQQSTPPSFEPDVEVALGKVNDRIDSKAKTPQSVKTLSIVWKVAAMLVIGLGIFGIVKFTNTSSDILVIVSQNETPKRITLPDGSSITLNKGSELTYPSKFSKNQRKISFNGEAYFSIAKNPDKPFIIESPHSITKVLGTEFNLSARKADTIVKITVTEGLVSFKLDNNSKKEEILVEAGQVGEINASIGKITKKVNEDLNFMAWKTGKLVFNNDIFGNAIHKISNFYDKKIEIGEAELSKAIFTASFDSLEFDEVLSTIELLMDVNIEQEDDGFIILEKL